MKEKSRNIKIGVMLNSMTVPAWTYKILSEIKKDPNLELRLFIVNCEMKSLAFRIKNISRYLRTLLWMFYLKADYWVMGKISPNPDPFKSSDLSKEFSHVEQMKVVPDRDRFFHRFKPEDIDNLKEKNLDVILLFGFSVLTGDILRAARYGIWSYHHDDNKEYRGGPACFWEMYEGNPVTGSVLQILTEELDGGKVIYRSHSRTCFFSLQINREGVYWKSAKFLLRRLNDLQKQGWGAIESLETYNEKFLYEKAIYKAPNNLAMLAFFWRTLLICLKKGWDLLFSLSQWELAYQFSATPSIFINKTVGFDGIERIRPPKDRYFADPFCFKHENDHFIFFEDYRYKSKKGLISFIRLAENGGRTEPQVALELPYHLSYPYIFEYRNSIFLLPETADNRTVELYRCKQFPDQWELDRVIFENVRGVDATLIEHANLFWLFCNMASNGVSTNDELYLFFSSSLKGDWTAHPQNPVVSNIQRSRPAGRPFWWNGSLIRPSQNSAKIYGHSLNFNKVEVMTESVYVEKILHSITPPNLPGYEGVHTYNFNEGLEVIDIRRKVPKFFSKKY